MRKEVNQCLHCGRSGCEACPLGGFQEMIFCDYCGEEISRGEGVALYDEVELHRDCVPYYLESIGDLKNI